MQSLSFLYRLLAASAAASILIINWQLVTTIIGRAWNVRKIHSTFMYMTLLYLFLTFLLSFKYSCRAEAICIFQLLVWLNLLTAALLIWNFTKTAHWICFLSTVTHLRCLKLLIIFLQMHALYVFCCHIYFLLTFCNLFVLFRQFTAIYLRLFNFTLLFCTPGIAKFWILCTSKCQI